MAFSYCSGKVKNINENTLENLGESIEIGEFQYSLLNAAKDRSPRTRIEPMALSEEPVIVEKSKDLLRANGYSDIPLLTSLQLPNLTMNVNGLSILGTRAYALWRER